MKKIVVTALSIASLFASECSVQNLTWTAYKTPLKLGVTGSFDKIAFTQGKQCLEGAKVTINKHSVNTKNPGRDRTLDQFFFSLLKGDIVAKILKVHEKRLDVAITLNGITKTVPFTYTKDGNLIQAKGVIDIFDFQGNKALASIAKACFDKHQGKTWNDVTLTFEIAQ
ncbi:YceI family protein [Nitratiruptor sp. SB155-2]|uniref:YceI family protein n=1 Tax=Nitratiruptor sp. (strain SB155-2) TaxID=387092 RepID=UPI0001587063|nr:YceI family protein [Nitratiruptor sp. SB155-2]BAF70262.1 conserved hypothetical protein [Nitratiruptor sp. SB155-2]